MRYSECGGSEADLDYAMGVAERGFAAESPAARFTTLCLMAVIVSRYPPGPEQEDAEDRLAALIGEVALSPADLALLRRFRAQGLQPQAPRRAAPRRVAGSAPRRPA